MDESSWPISINKGHRASHSTVASLLGERGKQFAKLPVGREEPGNAQFRPGLFCLSLALAVVWTRSARNGLDLDLEPGVDQSLR